MRDITIEKELKAASKRVAGKDIQSIADVLWGLGFILSVFGGISFFSTDNFLVGLVVLAVGIMGSWASTRFLRGFGELVEDAAANREVSKRILTILESQYGHASSTEAEKANEYRDNQDPQQFF